jgi:hypothetical protein
MIWLIVYVEASVSGSDCSPKVDLVDSHDGTSLCGQLNWCGLDLTVWRFVGRVSISLMYVT